MYMSIDKFLLVTEVTNITTNHMILLSCMKFKLCNTDYYFINTFSLFLREVKL